MKKEAIEVYTIGLCSASVCASKDMLIEEVTRQLNLMHPTGVGPWLLSGDETFSGGQPHPCPCNDKPQTHMHYLFHC